MDYQVIPSVMIFVGLVGGLLTVLAAMRAESKLKDQLGLVELLFHSSTLIGLGLLIGPWVCFHSSSCSMCV
jgi:hypothetical protein